MKLKKNFLNEEFWRLLRGSVNPSRPSGFPQLVRNDSLPEMPFSVLKYLQKAKRKEKKSSCLLFKHEEFTLSPEWILYESVRVEKESRVVISSIFPPTLTIPGFLLCDHRAQTWRPFLGNPLPRLTHPERERIHLWWALLRRSASIRSCLSRLASPLASATKTPKNAGSSAQLSA